jgi:hypothetical protein
MRLHLLELVGCKDRSELLPGVFVDGSQLLFHDHWGDCGVVAQSSEFLVAVGQNGFELRGLIGGEVELLAEPCGLTLGVVSVVVGFYGRGRRGVLLLGDEKTTGESQDEGGGEYKAVHW